MRRDPAPEEMEREEVVCEMFVAPESHMLSPRPPPTAISESSKSCPNRVRGIFVPDMEHGISTLLETFSAIPVRDRVDTQPGERAPYRDNK